MSWLGCKSLLPLGMRSVFLRHATDTGGYPIAPAVDSLVLLRQRVDLHLPHHVGGGEQSAVGRDRDRADPILELTASPRADIAHVLAVFQVPDLDERVAAA